jgi:hypothetical protein
MQIIMKIQINQPESDSESDEGTPIGESLEHLQREIEGFTAILTKIEEHIQNVEKRVENSNLKFGPKPVMEAWCLEKGLEAPFTLKEWFQTVLANAVHMNLEDRVLTFKDVPWDSKITVFDLFRQIPKLLKIEVD